MHIIEVGLKGHEQGYAYSVVSSLDLQRAVQLLLRADAARLFTIKSWPADDIAAVRQHIQDSQPTNAPTSFRLLEPLAVFIFEDGFGDDAGFIKTGPRTYKRVDVDETHRVSNTNVAVRRVTL